jgi:hypothetical protein
MTAHVTGGVTDGDTLDGFMVETHLVPVSLGALPLLQQLGAGLGPSKQQQQQQQQGDGLEGGNSWTDSQQPSGGNNKR